MFDKLPGIPAVDLEIKATQGMIEDCEYELAHLKERMNALCMLRRVIQTAETHNL
jgi:hypothetical protein